MISLQNIIKSRTDPFVTPCGSEKHYPGDILASSPTLPISPFERSNDVIAKFEINRDQVPGVLDWYRNRGFNTVADNTQTNGYGSHGISFVIATTDQILTLVVKQWKDY